ncbi:hypothetical protein HYS00_00140 [Candidatus Microgenomates bacterium]|nr:hypothetical protein [Candidatus Microgenomates bacterium]
MRPIVSQLLDQLRAEEDVFKVSSLLHQIIRDEQVPLVTVSRELGAKPSYISHLMRIKKLPSIIIDGYYSKTVSLSHLFIISRLSNVPDMIRVYEQVLSHNLPTAKTEELVREILFHVDSRGERIDKHKIQLLKEKFKAKKVDLEIVQTRTKGRIALEMKGNLEKTTAFIEELVSALDFDVEEMPASSHNETDSL